MHHCLNVAEILKIVFDYVFDDAVTGASSVLAGALACKAFQGPAFDVLWHTQPSMIHLVKCMPADLWDNTGKRHYRRVLVFRRALIPSDWERFNFYAPRIRKLGFPATQERKPEALLSSVYRSLSIFKSQHPLLPNLRQLRWSGEDVDSFPYIHLFLSHKLTCFESRLLVLDPERSVDMLLMGLKRSSPFLQTLNLSGWSPSAFKADVAIAFSDLVCHLDGLKTLSCGSSLLSDDAVLHLANSPELLVLHTSNKASQLYHAITEPIRFLPSLEPFSVLQQISLPAHNLRDVSILLQHIHSRSLESLSVAHLEHPDESEIRNCFELLDTDIMQSSLRSIRIYREHALQNGNEAIALMEQESHTITFRTLKPLLSLKALTCLDLRVYGAFELDDAAMHSMATSWPHLQQLHLGMGSWGRTSGITLDGLVPLVVHCPDLESLSLITDGTVRNMYPDRRPGNGAMNTKITSLELGDSTLESPPVVAAFLSDLFPNLVDIFAWVDYAADDPDGESWFDRWKEVESSLRIFANVRQQERNHGSPMPIDAPGA
ncbi:hypothetical protein PLICRDRAFT_28183 [Plicaturopsis crispa FD-325 SS-3]|nr:hypothetical protein PLICRDRAFT_28183 [Plicaturopsis crispa FD-325 SS-3]